MEPAARLLRTLLPAVLASVGVWIAGATGVHAGRIELEIRERDGRPLEGQKVSLRPHDAGDRWYRATARGVTGPGGKLLLHDIPAGTYTFGFSRPADPDLILPEHNPWVDTPIVTLPDESSVVEITIEFWRGVYLSLDVLSRHSDLPNGKIVLTHVDTGERVEYGTRPKDGSEKHIERSMVEGRWEAVLEAPPGFVVSDLVVNGESIVGGVARIDTSRDPRTQFIHWELSSPCEVWGRLRPAEVGSTLYATLLQPGPWAEPELARGRRHDRVPVFRWEMNREFHIRLPEGTWRFQPEGERLESSEPPFVDLVLVPGDVRRQDFDLTESEGDNGTALQIVVLTATGDRVPNALVALYRIGDVGEAEPLATRRTGGENQPRYTRGRARFEGVAKGSYEVVAGHAEWLDGRAKVAFDPEGKEGKTRHSVRVREGAVVKAFAFDHEDETPVPKVDVMLEWLGEEFPSILDDAELDAARRQRKQRTDATGFAVVKGLAHGIYRIEARVTGEQQMTRYARIRRGDANGEEFLDLRVMPPGEYDVELLIYPGASISGRIRCDDAGPLPPAAAFRVYDVGANWDGIELGPGSKNAPQPALAFDTVLLDGKHLDQFAVGPLEDGGYVLALRPEGYEGWAWSYGTDLREDAALVQVSQTQAIDLGTVDAVCSPAVIVRPVVKSGEAVPDLRLGSYEVDVTARRENGDEIDVYPTVEARRGHLLVAGLEDASTDLVVEIHHPYLIPPSLIYEAEALDLERGSRPVKQVTFRDVGGAIVVHTASPAVRLIVDGKAVALAETVEAEARFEGVFPGVYVLETCSDAACTAIDGGRSEVRVERYRTRTLEF